MIKGILQIIFGLWLLLFIIAIVGAIVGKLIEWFGWWLGIIPVLIIVFIIVLVLLEKNKKRTLNNGLGIAESNNLNQNNSVNSKESKVYESSDEVEAPEIEKKPKFKPIFVDPREIIKQIEKIIKSNLKN